MSCGRDLNSQPHPPCPQRLSNILKQLRPHIITGNLNLAPDLPISIVGHADAARFSNALKASSYVDAIAEDIVVIENDVPDMDTDTELDPVVVRHISVLRGHVMLELRRAVHRVHNAGKLDKHAVASGLDDVTAMRGDCGIDKSLSERFQLGMRASFVAAH